MADDRWNIKWEQLNQRSRWYSSQLWYVPFAYVGIAGLVFDKIIGLSYPLNSIGLIFLGIFSISVLVHVLFVKFYERRAVSSMQDMEGRKTISGGGSPWYLSFAWYIKVMICVASYFFFAYGVFLVKTTHIWQQVLLAIIAFLLITILYVVIFLRDHNRNRDLVKKIRRRT